MSAPEVLVHRGQDLLAAAAAARLVTRIADAQAARGPAAVSYTHLPPHTRMHEEHTLLTDRRK
ncbi:hypothetical protein HUX53_33975, partial [Actinomadura sp. BRA 177]|nr:hypothetical protein [Actinomadura sp. BRA 177]